MSVTNSPADTGNIPVKLPDTTTARNEDADKTTAIATSLRNLTGVLQAYPGYNYSLYHTAAGTSTNATATKANFLHAFVILPDHLHVLLTPAESTAKAIQLIKGGFSFALREHFKGEVWHTGHHEHRIHDASDDPAQLAYITNNPIRKNYTDYPHIHTRRLDKMDTP